MDIATIQSKILEAENQLLFQSERVKAIADVDTINNWIVTVLSSDAVLSKSLNFPQDKKSKKALLTLIKERSPITEPLVSLLAKRIFDFIGTISEVHNHHMRGPKLEPLLNNYQPLLNLVFKYHEEYEVRKTITSVFEALQARRLHIYKSRPKEPDIRVILRALYEDKAREDTAAVQGMLDFIFEQLRKHVIQTGFIAQPRHVWWAILTLITEAEDSWLEKNQFEINNIVNHVLMEVEYIPRSDDFGNFVPELDSKSNERSWGTINQIRLLKRNLTLYVEKDVTQVLEKRIESNIRSILDDKSELSIKFLQNKLLLLYEALGYYNNATAKSLSKAKVIDLTGRKVGELFYADGVLAQIRSVLNSISIYIANPNKWQRATLTSMLISSTPSQGKSALVKQMEIELQKIATRNGKRFCINNYTVGSPPLQTAKELSSILDDLKTTVDKDLIRLVVFDEFDKADFDFYLPFLPHLEKPSNADREVTIYIFAQSSSPTNEIFRSYAHSARVLNKALPDFCTRLELGFIDLPDLKTSPEQRIFSLIGIARENDRVASKIQRNCLTYFARNEKILGPRALRTQFGQNVHVIDEVIFLRPDLEKELIEKDKNYFKSPDTIEIIG